ncbi:MAG: helix-turn-helix domain-containing protein [Candidatus Methanoculleus thermohydrogenotrophicum]|jgi:hypothetical protein|nr:helix-turn-helix domain-containing protein [Candidatus Methanoculleus thermohydrogenotrophicum]
MTGREQITIARHVSLSVLKKQITHPKGLPQVVPRLVFVQLRYKGMSVVNAAEAVGVSHQTGYNWQERWNEGGTGRIIEEPP